MRIGPQATAAALWIVLAGCGARGAFPFREAAAETGLTFRHFTGATGDFYMPEIVGSGVALLDYDGDGDLDVYLIQSTFLDGTKTLAQALYAPAAGCA